MEREQVGEPRRHQQREAHGAVFFVLVERSSSEAKEGAHADNGDGTKTLHLGERTRTKKALGETWEQRRARFEADLKIAQGGNGVVKTEWVAA